LIEGISKLTLHLLTQVPIYSHKNADFSGLFKRSLFDHEIETCKIELGDYLIELIESKTED
jgi:hypothetical protein